MNRDRITALGAAIISAINRREPKFQYGDKDSLLIVLTALNEVTAAATAHAERNAPTPRAAPPPDPAASLSGNKAPEPAAGEYCSSEEESPPQSSGQSPSAGGPKTSN